MSLRLTTILVITITTLALVGLLLLSLNATLVPHFERQQDQGIYQELQRAQTALDVELEHLEQTARDWAKWDDTYAFVQNPGPAYLQANLQLQTFVDLNLNLMAMLNVDGRVVYSQYVDLRDGQPAEMPAELRASLADARLLAAPSSSAAQRGLLALPGGPLLLVAHPILPTGGQGQAAGTLLIGRRLDEIELQRLGESVQLPFQLAALGALASPADRAALQTLQAGAVYTVHNASDQAASGYILQDDIFGQPGWLLKIDQQRTTYKNGMLLVNYLFTALTMSALTFAVILYLILEMTVLAPMRRLSAEMGEIARSADPARRVTVARKDEITALSRSINGLLAELESSQAGLRSALRPSVGSTKREISRPLNITRMTATKNSASTPNLRREVCHSFLINLPPTLTIQSKCSRMCTMTVRAKARLSYSWTPRPVSAGAMMSRNAAKMPRSSQKLFLFIVYRFPFPVNVTLVLHWMVLMIARAGSEVV